MHYTACSVKNSIKCTFNKEVRNNHDFQSCQIGANRVRSFDEFGLFGLSYNCSHGISPRQRFDEHTEAHMPRNAGNLQGIRDHLYTDGT